MPDPRVGESKGRVKRNWPLYHKNNVPKAQDVASQARPLPMSRLDAGTT